MKPGSSIIRIKFYAHTIAQHLSVSESQGVNHRDDIRVLSKTLLLLLRYKAPQLVDVDNWAPVLIVGEVVVAHTNLTEVTWMVLVEVGSNYRGDLRQKDFDK